MDPYTANRNLLFGNLIGLSCPSFGKTQLRLVDENTFFAFFFLKSETIIQRSSLKYEFQTSSGLTEGSASGIHNSPSKENCTK